MEALYGKRVKLIKIAVGAGKGSLYLNKYGQHPMLYTTAEILEGMSSCIHYTYHESCIYAVLLDDKKGLEQFLPIFYEGEELSFF